MDGIEVKIVITLPNGDVQEIPLEGWNIERGVCGFQLGDGTTFREYDGSITVSGFQAKG